MVSSRHILPVALYGFATVRDLAFRKYGRIRFKKDLLASFTSRPSSNRCHAASSSVDSCLHCAFRGAYNTAGGEGWAKWNMICRMYEQNAYIRMKSKDWHGG